MRTTLVSYSNSTVFISKPCHDFAAFMQDAAISIGLLACLAIGNNGMSFSAATQYFLLTHQMSFHGATGDVIFNNRTGSRTYDSTHYQLININYMNSKNSNKETETKQIYHFTVDVASFYQGLCVQGT